MKTTNNEIILNILTDFGLSKKEAVVYLSLLELELATAQEVARHTHLNRSSTYVIIEALQHQGLISTSEDKKVRRYAAVNPEVLLQIAKKRAEKQERTKQKISTIIPELRALHKDTRRRPKVQIFEGQSGLEAVLDDSVIHNKEKLKRTFSSTGVSQILKGDFPEYIRKRAANKIKLRGIHPHKETTEKLVAQNSLPQDEIYMIPPGKYEFPTNLSIYDNKISYMSPENGGLAILIESKEIADVMKSIFDMAWEEAKRLSKQTKKQKTK